MAAIGAAALITLAACGSDNSGSSGKAPDKLGAAAYRLPGPVLMARVEEFLATRQMDELLESGKTD